MVPLDRSVFEPLKAYFNSEANSWMLRNVVKAIRIYQIAQLVGAAWVKAVSPVNNISGFKASGMWPFDRDAFGDDEFIPASVTGRPAPPNHPPSASDATPVGANTSSTNNDGFVRPEDIFTYPRVSSLHLQLKHKTP